MSAPAHQTTVPRRISSVSSTSTYSSAGRQSPVEVHQPLRYHLNPEQESRLNGGRFGEFSVQSATSSPASNIRVRLNSTDHRRPSQCEDRNYSCLSPEDQPANLSYGEQLSYLSDCSDVFVDQFGEEQRSPTELTRVERHRKWSRGERSKTVDATSTRQKSVTGPESKDINPGNSLIATWPKDVHSNVYKEDGEYLIFKHLF